MARVGELYLIEATSRHRDLALKMSAVGESEWYGVLAIEHETTGLRRDCRRDVDHHARRANSGDVAAVLNMM